MSVDAVWAGISTGSAVASLYFAYQSMQSALDAMGRDEDGPEAKVQKGRRS